MMRKCYQIIDNVTSINEIKHFSLNMNSVVNDSNQIISMCSIGHCMLKYIEFGSNSQEAAGTIKELSSTTLENPLIS